jgi:hypothetical protein
MENRGIGAFEYSRNVEKDISLSWPATKRVFVNQPQSQPLTWSSRKKKHRKGDPCASRKEVLCMYDRRMTTSMQSSSHSKHYITTYMQLPASPSDIRSVPSMHGLWSAEGQDQETWKKNVLVSQAQDGRELARLRLCRESGGQLACLTEPTSIPP